MIVVSQKIRDSARGQTCTVRQPSCCNFDPATTVSAHLPCGHKGMGMKSPDFMIVHACSCCHDAIDGRTKGISVDAKDLLRALAETMLRLVKNGLIRVGT